MMLHAGEPLAPHDLWRAWSFEPVIWIPLAATLVLYMRGIREAMYRSTNALGQLMRQRRWFVAGFGILTVSLLSPIHAAGASLFSAHMIQHELLMAVAAPMLVLSRPGLAMLWSFPDGARHSVGRAISKREFQSVWQAITHPVAAFTLHGAAIWLWHAPGLYDMSVTNDAVHALQHASFLGTALLFWWSILEANHARGNEGAAIVSLFLTGIHTTLLGALLALSDQPVYHAYSSVSSTPFGLTAVDDQQLGGLIMWVPGGLVYVAAALYLLLQWIQQSGVRRSRLDAARTRSAASAVAAIAIFFIVGCTEDPTRQWAAEMTGGTPSRGQQAIRSYGCQSCHTIPGIQGAKALVGPPLAGIASRSYIAGVMSNTPQHMIEWLRNPPAIDSKTAMPNMNVTERDARDIAAYLYTLR
jgi:putative membrane protein